jgi:hypothetical protein
MSLLDYMLEKETSATESFELLILQTDRGPEYNNFGWLQFLGYLTLVGKFSTILYGRLLAGHTYAFRVLIINLNLTISHINETDGKFKGITDGKANQDILKPQEVQHFLDKCHDVTKLEVEHTRHLTVRDWRTWLETCGPKKISNHTFPLDYLVWFDEKKGTC